MTSGKASTRSVYLLTGGDGGQQGSIELGMPPLGVPHVLALICRRAGAWEHSLIARSLVSDPRERSSSAGAPARLLLCQKQMPLVFTTRLKTLNARMKERKKTTEGHELEKTTSPSFRPFIRFAPRKKITHRGRAV